MSSIANSSRYALRGLFQFPATHKPVSCFVDQFFIGIFKNGFYNVTSYRARRQLNACVFNIAQLEMCHQEKTRFHIFRGSAIIADPHDFIVARILRKRHAPMPKSIRANSADGRMGSPFAEDRGHLETPICFRQQYDEMQFQDSLRYSEPQYTGILLENYPINLQDILEAPSDRVSLVFFRDLYFIFGSRSCAKLPLKHFLLLMHLASCPLPSPVLSGRNIHR